VSINAERWDTNAVHHSYLDQYGNRCERFELTPGVSQITYEAQLAVTQSADVIEPDAPEVPVQLLPDEVLNFVMPSRFCLPDELGHEAWQRFGEVAPGWARVQTIVDYVHGHLEFVPGASNPWTTAADAYRAGQGVCRDFAHLAITLCRALNIPAATSSATSRTSAFRRRPSRWISQPGSRPTSTAVGTPSTRETTVRASGVSLSGVAGTPSTSP
jgi:transglutaminase-like putative cysteine protease